MTAHEEPGMGPVIRDNRRIDPVTGQARRGKHAASQPAGTMGAGRPGGAGARHGRPGEDAGAQAEEAISPEGEAVHGEAGGGATAAPAEPAPAGQSQSKLVSQLQSQLAERTADLQRLQAEY